MIVESHDSQILRFEDSAESSNRILKPKDVESNLESNLITKGCSNLESNLKISGAESKIESNLKISWIRLEY